MSGHYSVFLSQTADDAEKTAYQAYEDAVLLPDSQDAKDFWVGLKEKIAEYF
jgi:arabinogalactan oligomer/maltooligosaccharide transport system substrate-binding protein